MCLGQMWNGLGWSVARLQVQTNTGFYIIKSMGGLLPINLALWWSMNEACALVEGHVHLRGHGVGWQAFHLTCLETQTKESNMCLSQWF